MESQSQNPAFRNNPENFHPCNANKVFLDTKNNLFLPFWLPAAYVDHSKRCQNLPPLHHKVRHKTVLVNFL